jgi:hypothetical protein
MPSHWSDVSQYQDVCIDDSYPYEIFCYRTNSGDKEDILALENGWRAKEMLDNGRLKLVLPYYFFRPGQANCDLHRNVLERSGLWLHPNVATMIDVEDAGGEIQGDQSAEVNDEFERLAGWYGNRKRVFGYLNGVANESLWQTRPPGIVFVTPSYSYIPGVWATPPPPLWLQDSAFGHQYTDVGRCLPWPEGVDLNYSASDVNQIKAILGIGEDDFLMSLSPEQQQDVATGSEQLLRYQGVIREPSEWLKEILGRSWKDREGPWFADAFGAVVNEIVWDGYDLKEPLKDKELLDYDGSEKLSVVSILRILGANILELRKEVADLAAHLRPATPEKATDESKHRRLRK